MSSKKITIQVEEEFEIINEFDIIEFEIIPSPLKPKPYIPKLKMEPLKLNMEPLKPKLPFLNDINQIISVRFIIPKSGLKYLGPIFTTIYELKDLFKVKVDLKKAIECTIFVTDKIQLQIYIDKTYVYYDIPKIPIKKIIKQLNPETKVYFFSWTWFKEDETKDDVRFYYKPNKINKQCGLKIFYLF